MLLVVGCGVSTEDIDEDSGSSQKDTNYSEGQIGSLLLSRNEFPKDWVVTNDENRVQGLLQTGLQSAKRIEISLYITDNAQADFQREKTEIQSKINTRGRSGDEIEEVRGYDMFAWMQGGVPGQMEQWQIIGVYRNVIMKLNHDATLWNHDKDIAVSLAKKQMDKIKRTTPIAPRPTATPVTYTPTPYSGESTVTPLSTKTPEPMPTISPTPVPFATPTATSIPTSTPVPTPVPTVGPTAVPTATPVTFSWISGGPTIDEYIHVPEGESLEYGQVKIHGSVSVDDRLIIDWGDGNTDSVKLQPGSREFTLPNHAYARNGEYEAYIQGADTDGNYGVLNFKVLVENAAPTIKLSKKSLISLDIETEIELQLGNTYQDSHFVIISWGDDSPISTYSLGPGESTLIAKHTYPLENDGNPYNINFEVIDEHGASYKTSEGLLFSESFRGEWKTIFPDALSDLVTVNIPDVGNEDAHTGFFLFQNPDLPLNLDEFSGKLDTGESITSPSTALNNLSKWATYGYGPTSAGASAIALNDTQIFIIGGVHGLPYSSVEIYDIPSDSYTSPIYGKTPYLLHSPALHVLDNGQVLIVGGLKNTSVGYVPNELTLIYDPVSQTISSVEVNPLAAILAEESMLENHLIGLANGKVLLLGTADQFHNSVTYDLRTALATLFDPSTNSYTPISGDNDVTYFYDSWCGYTDPIKFSDGRIFLGATILSSDLSSAVPIDLSNVDGEQRSTPEKFNGQPCYFASDITFSSKGQILLEDDKILFVSMDREGPISFMFEGNSFRLTTYQPTQNLATPYLSPAIYHDWDYGEQKRRIVIFGNGIATEFIY